MIKNLSIALFLSLSALFSAGHALRFLPPPPDSIPPPPPPGPVTLAGPDKACVGETSVYYTEVPLACACQWLVNGVVQPDTTPEFTITWTQSGLQTVTLEFVCTGQTYLSDSIPVEVSQTPTQPGPIQGPDEVCLFSSAIFTTTVGPFDTCQWYVGGVLQPATGPVMTYYFGQPGLFDIMVTNHNHCGTGGAAFFQTRTVTLPIVFLGNDTTILQGHYLMLDAGNPGCSYLWSTGETTRIIWVNAPGLYSVEVTNACGMVSDEIQVSVMVGTSDQTVITDQPQITVFQGELIFSDLPRSLVRIQVFDLAGRMIFEGIPEKNIKIASGGMLMVRITTAREIISRKILIF